MSKILNIQGSEITDQGIVRLADYLRTNLTDDFNLIIGCTPYVNDIDGVLIGRGNIYAIECKNWKGQIEATSYGKWLQEGETRDNPLHQTRNNAVALAKWLRVKVGSYDKVWVQGLLVFTHDKCYIIDKRDGDSNTGVTVLRLEELGGWIMEQKEKVSKEVMEKVEGVFEGVGGEIENRKDVCTPEMQERAELLYKNMQNTYHVRGRNKLKDIFKIIFALCFFIGIVIWFTLMIAGFESVLLSRIAISGVFAGFIGVAFLSNKHERSAAWDRLPSPTYYDLQNMGVFDKHHYHSE